MSLVETLARPRSWRLPGVDGLIQWIVPLLIIVVWQAACSFGFVSARVLPAPFFHGHAINIDMALSVTLAVRA